MNITTRMSNKELKYAEIVVRVVNREMTSVSAATLLGISVRTAYRLRDKIASGGASALAHAARGRAGNNRIPDKERKKIEDLLVSKYFDYGQTLAAEKLRELDKIDHDPKTVGSIMIELGLKEPKRTKSSKTDYREWREPRARYGELVQFDGSYHEWFEDRLPGEFCLLAAIDDATGNIISLSFREHEGLLPVLGFWREYALKHGLPQSIYTDKFSTYKMNQKLAVENPDTKTQFGRVMDSLRVNVIFANSSQAKGRVERLFQTLQDRLVKELRLNGISTVAEANRFLEEVFISDFNKRFGRTARETGDLHRPLTVQEKHRADNIFCRNDERVVTNDFTISHNTVSYQLLETPGLAIRPRDQAIVRTHVDGSISIAIRGKTARHRIIQKSVRNMRTFMLNQPKTLAPALVA